MVGDKDLRCRNCVAEAPGCRPTRNSTVALARLWEVRVLANAATPENLMPRFALLLCCGFACVGIRLDAAPPTDPELRARIIGSPVALEVQPQTIALSETRASQQVLIAGRYADGSVRDLTSLCDWSATSADLLDVAQHGLVTGLGDGETVLDVHVGDQHARIPVTISNSGKSRPISFRREVMPVLSAAGCSDIRCHGAPSGKNGFRLSLWGSDPDLDYQQLVRDSFGRRTNAFVPGSSLILQKALTNVSHAGGKRFDYASPFAQLLRGWQAEGLHDDADVDSPSSRLRTLEVLPNRRVLHAPARWQQLAVRATFDEGTVSPAPSAPTSPAPSAPTGRASQAVDVTRLTTFTSTDLAVATVSRTGLVEFKRQGEVAILCRFLDAMVPVRLMHIASPPADYRWPDPPANNYIDTHVFAKLQLLHITPSELCSDAQFVRRLYLDLCGILPTPAETQAFVAGTEPDKRAKLIDKLLQRPEYADFWTKKWMDVLRVSRDSIQLAGAQAYQSWLREKIANDISFTEVVQALLTSQGESYKDPSVNFFCVAPMPKEVSDPHYLQKDLAEATAQLFLGVRLQCAQCHNHPYERWTQDDYLGLAACFTQVKRSRLGKAGPKGRPDRRQMAISLDFKSAEITRESNGQPVAPGFLGQPAADVAAEQDRRRALADWLTDSNNPFLGQSSRQPNLVSFARSRHRRAGRRLSRFQSLGQ